jgi:hypothetical protein
VIRQRRDSTIVPGKRGRGERIGAQRIGHVSSFEAGLAVSFSSFGTGTEGIGLPAIERKLLVPPQRFPSRLCLLVPRAMGSEWNIVLF